MSEFAVPPRKPMPTTAMPSKRPSGFCALCDSIANFPSRHPIAETATTVVFLNPRQRTPGSVLIVPRRHVSPISALTDEEMIDAFHLAREVGAALSASLRPEGLHSWCRLNDETPDRFVHHHFQVVPRYEGQTYSYAKSWEIELTPDDVLRQTAKAVRAALRETSELFLRIAVSEPSEAGS